MSLYTFLKYHEIYVAMQANYYNILHTMRILIIVYNTIKILLCRHSNRNRLTAYLIELGTYIAFYILKLFN